MIQWHKIGLIAPCLTLLCACSTKPVTVTEIRQVTLPDYLLLPCVIPQAHVTDNKSHLEYTLALRDSLEDCNEQLRAAREANRGQ